MKQIKKEIWDNIKKFTHIATRLKPKLFAGVTQNGALYKIQNPELIKMLQNVSYLGSGLSSDVWDLNNGYVLKITRERDTIKLFEHLYKYPIIGLPEILAIGKNQVIYEGFHHNGDFEKPKLINSKYTWIIQKKYSPIKEESWHKIEEALDYIDLGDKPHRWARGSANEPARANEGIDISIQLATRCKKIKRDDPNHPAAQCVNAFNAISYLMKNAKFSKLTGIDIDHADNWGEDGNGNPVIIDPIYTIKDISTLSTSP